MVALEHERAEPSLDSPSDMQMVAAFIDLALEYPRCSVVVLNSKYLRKGKRLGLSNGMRFKVWNLSDVDRSEILKVCVSHGHLSALFTHDNIHAISSRFLERAFYGPGARVHLGAGDSSDPMDTEGMLSLQSFLSSEEGKSITELLGFSHDAAQFYEIHPRED